MGTLCRRKKIGARTRNEFLVGINIGKTLPLEWAEIDWDNRLWRIPAEKMKARQPHLVPLAEQALEILRKLQPMTGYTRYLYPCVRSEQCPMREATVNGGYEE